MISSEAAISALELRFVARIEKNQRVQVAVARVKNIADLKAVLRADFVDAPQRLREVWCAESRHPARSRWAKGGRRRRRRFCGLSRAGRVPERRGPRELRARDAARQISATSSACGFDGFGEPSTSSSSTAAQSSGKSRVNVGFDGAQRPAIEHFAGGGSDAARGDVRDGFGGVVERFENREQSFYGFGICARVSR